MTAMFAPTVPPGESRQGIAIGQDAAPDSPAPGRRPLAWPAGLRSRLTDWLWYRRAVRVQLLVSFVAIGLAAALIAGGVTIVQARKSTRLEIAASLRMAEVLVSETAELLQQEPPAENFLANLPARLRFVRHLRITVRDAAGFPVATRSAADAVARADERSPAPAWFAALIAPPPASREVPVVVKGQRIGSVLLVGEPSDEIAEVWENTVDFAVVSLAVGFAAIAALHLLLGRVLDPLTALAAALADLERRNFAVRLARPKARELAAIADRFNALAQALEAVRAENARLNRRLITAQDDERRRTALELHDEVGPSLFGLKANATTIANAAGELPDALRRLPERARDMLAIIEHLQAINRNILNRLRPMALGHIPLADLIGHMVRDLARQHPDLAFAFSAGKLSPSYGDSIDLTVYRCVQEGLTNVIRHAKATRVEIDLAPAANRDGEPASSLQLVIRDDGCGIDPAAPGGRGLMARGRGLMGMQERVQGLAGTFLIQGTPGGGTLLRIAIPLAAQLSDVGDMGGAAE